MRVLIVPDKFKGTLTAREAAEAIAAGWREARPNDELELLPMSDGGDGFGEIVGELLGAMARTTTTVNAAHEAVEVAWWWSEERHTAIVESARTIGLAMLPPGKFHPFELDTAGLGRLLHKVAGSRPGANLIVGIGGSATNDGGFGMARELGFRFIDSDGREISRWVELEDLARIEPPPEQAPFASVTIATDVTNPLLGPEGATRAYGPQKGLKTEDFSRAENCLAALAACVRRDLKAAAEAEPGTGAAGGLGYGLRVFLNGAFEAGFEIFAKLARLDERTRRADLVLTGEGSIDASTLMGKGTGAVARLAKLERKRCIGLAGVARERGDWFTAVHGIYPEAATLEDALARPAESLRKLSLAVARNVEELHAGVVTSPRTLAPS
jgi:glycerate kinase